jgi:trehalose/maltose hydrolase-like predicted phosphorylase
VSVPISPPPVRRWQPAFLPAYVGNGLIGLRVPRLALRDGVAIVSGFAGEHPSDRVESFARAPYPLAGDLVVDAATLSAEPERANLREQRYDFETGELTTRFAFDAGSARADVEVLTFCSRTQPTIAMQELTVTVDRACDLALVAAVDPAGVPGRRLLREVQPAATVDGCTLWESAGALSTCGAAYASELAAGGDHERSTAAGEIDRLQTRYALRARAGRRYRLRQLTSLVPERLHHEPHRQAVRLVHAAVERGFDVLRDGNRRAWNNLWLGRVELVGAPRRWQAFADAALFYLHSSAHPSSPSSTSMFGLSYWPDYHYYRGHVMWDIEAFAVPPLLLTAPLSARALLDFRVDSLPAAKDNADLAGYAGAQYPWESSLRLGEESAPAEGAAAAREHHVSLDVAHALTQFVHATGDVEYARTRAWPVVRAVAEWLGSRVERTRRGYEIRHVTGVAEKERAEDNSAFTNLAAIRVLRDACQLADFVERPAEPSWSLIADRLVLPLDRRTGILRNYDGHRVTDEKGETPEAASALLLLRHDLGPRVEAATFRHAIDHCGGYIGSPMLSPLIGVLAARLGDRGRALELLERGYGDFVLEPYSATDEYSPLVFPERERAGPFAANLGGFLLGCLYGLTGVRLGPGDLDSWCERPVAMPSGWRGVEVERVWARGGAARLSAQHGDERARLSPA